MKSRQLVAIAALTLAAAYGVAAGRLSVASAAGGNSPTVIRSEKNDKSDSLRNLVRRVPPVPGPGPFSYHPIPGRSSHKALSTATSSPQPTGSDASINPSASANSQASASPDFVLPPDTDADIGPNHFVQWADQHLEVFDRTGNLLLGPSPGNTLWSGFGGNCETRSQGDLIVRYDRIAGRWVFTRFSFGLSGQGVPVGPYYQCFAVSTSGDPTDTYYRYSFMVSNSYFSAYPKLALWPDAYYMSANLFSGSGLSTFKGAGAIAFNRASMLAGEPASAAGFGPLGASYAGLLPSDLDGSIMPPIGSPNYFGAVDTSVAPSGSTFQLWEFHVDWITPSNSTFGTGSNSPNFHLTTSPYNWRLCDGSRSCIPQPGTTIGLDPVSDRLMNQLRYRRFADGHESLVANHTVNMSPTAEAGGNQAGIRWYEIRGPLSTSPMIYQQGTYAPDSNNRWMGSIAMDRAGDITLGFLVSGRSTYPSFRYTGRAALDSRGALTQDEVSVIVGSSPQLSTYYRSGDYSIIGVDPLDDCIFWYTHQYSPPTSNGGRQTRIGSFNFPNCGPPWSASYTATTTPTSWIQNQTESYTVSLTNKGSEPWPAGGTTPVHLGVHFARKGGGYGISGTDTSSGWLTDQRFSLPADLAPGATINLTISVTPPATTGNIVLEYEMVREHRSWFTQFADVSSEVLAGSVAGYGLTTTPSSWIRNQTETYTVRLTNRGNLPWPAGGTTPVHLGVHFARRGGGYGISGSDTSSGWLTDQRFSLPADLAPGAMINLTISVTPPATLGNLVLEYEMVREHRSWFGPFADVSAPVLAGPVAGYGVTATPSSWIQNQTETYLVSLTNKGRQRWPAGGATPVHLGVHFARKGGGYGISGSDTSSGWLTDQRFSLPADLAPGATINLTISVTPPTTIGNLVLEYEMVREHRSWFGQFADVSSPVLAGPVAGYGISATPSSWIQNQTESYAVRLTNRGNLPWPATGTTPVHLGVHFARKGGGYGVSGSGTSSGSGAFSGWLTDQRFSLPTDLAPGATVNLIISVTAPATTGNLVLEYEMVREGRSWFSQFTDVSTPVLAGSLVGLTAMPSDWTDVRPDLAVAGIILVGLALIGLVGALVRRRGAGAGGFVAASTVAGAVAPRENTTPATADQAPPV